jgi:hypothetical protein
VTSSVSGKRATAAPIARGLLPGAARARTAFPDLMVLVEVEKGFEPS